MQVCAQSAVMPELPWTMWIYRKTHGAEKKQWVCRPARAAGISGQTWGFKLLTVCICLVFLQIYPDESHYFNNAALEQHLYNSIVNFFAACFQVQDKLPIAPLKEEEDDD